MRHPGFHSRRFALSWACALSVLGTLLSSAPTLTRSAALGQGTVIVPNATPPGSAFAPRPSVPFQRPAGGVGLLGGSEPDGRYPSPQYYIGLEIYRSGDLEQAVDVLESAFRSSRRDINGRWIDAIPALTMLSECAWQLGDLEQSKQYLDQVFEIAIRSQGWLGRVDFRTMVVNEAIVSRPQWLWPAAASLSVLPLSNRVFFRQGDVLTEQSLSQGGTIQEQSFRPIDVAEIMRTLAVACHRRRILLGPLCKNDPVVTQLLNATDFPGNVSRDRFTRSFIGAMRTTEYFAQADDRRVIDDASQYSLIHNEVHALTPITLMAQAQAIAAAGRPLQALPVTANAANTAAALEQPEWIGEAMQLAAGCVGPDTAAAVARSAATAAVAVRRESRLATLHCLIAAADASVTAGDTVSASTFLNQAGELSSRRDVLLPRLDAYRAYVAARIAAASGSAVGGTKASEVDQSLAFIADFALNHRSRRRSLSSMPRLFQMGLIRSTILNSSSSGGGIGGMSGDELLASYADQPPIQWWRRDPVDAIAGCMADAMFLRIARAELAAANGSAESFLIATDHLLAARFLSKLPLGGRLAQVRALASRDESLLSDDALQLRKGGPPGLTELIAAIEAEQQAGPPGAAPAPAAVTLAASQSMENSVTNLAIQRMVFPAIAIPNLESKKPQQALPQRTAMLTFVALGNRVYGSLATNKKVTMWQVAGANRLPGEIGRLLKAIGVGKGRGKRIAIDESWKEIALSIRQRLIPDMSLLPTESFDQLCVVPDGPLWYLPFELLPQDDVSSAGLGDAMKIRYAATPGLAVTPTSLPTTRSTVGLASNKFFAPLDVERETVMRQEIVDGIKDPVVLSSAVGNPASFLGSRLGHVVVAATQNPNVKAPLKTNVAGYDLASPHGDLNAWLRLPAAAPDSVALMGIRTPVDIGQMGDGDELFTLLAGLQVAGVRDVLLSRWAVGGESTAILLRELTQELPFAGLAHSFERSRIILREAKLDPSAEPLLSRSDAEIADLSGSYPLFWAGYLLASPN